MIPVQPLYRLNHINMLAFFNNCTDMLIPTDWRPTSSVRKVVIPEHGCPFGRLHPKVTLVAVPPGVQQIHIILYETLKHTTHLSDAGCWRSAQFTNWQTSELQQTWETCTECTQYSCLYTFPDLHTITHHFIIGPVVCHGECSLPTPLNRVQVEENCDVPRCATQI